MIRRIHRIHNLLVVIVTMVYRYDVAVCADNTKNREPIATTKAGKILGSYGDGIFSFKGIPYGENTAHYRFQPPLPVQPWSGIRTTQKFGPMAPQTTVHPPNPLGLEISEDCLNLNVWTPGLRDKQKRPVLVWFHGGAYSNGTSNELLVDGYALAKRGNVVVVTVNHRLNIFGYLYLGEIGGKKYEASGNVGMLDLVLALQWVRDNIEEFGGDPSNVTIFGQSGGGAKCATLMAMPAARGLFHKVLTMSGQQLTGRRKEAATETTKKVLRYLHITPDSLEHLTSLPMKTLIEAIQKEYFGPVTDGIILPRDPFDPDASEISSTIPMIMDNTRFETATLIGLSDTSTFSLQWHEVAPKLLQHVRQFLGTRTPDSLVALYRQWYPRYSPSDVFFAITTATRSWRSMILQSERRALYHTAPTYVYLFEWQTSVNGGKLRSGHGMDIPFFFCNTEYGAQRIGKGTEQETLAHLMSDVLIAFARTGNPQTPSLPLWEPFTLEKRPTMIFTVPPRLEYDPRGKERVLFAPIPYIQPGTL